QREDRDERRIGPGNRAVRNAGTPAAASAARAGGADAIGKRQRPRVQAAPRPRNQRKIIGMLAESVSKVSAEQEPMACTKIGANATPVFWAQCAYTQVFMVPKRQR